MTSLLDFDDMMATHDVANNRSTPYMTRYERAKVLGVRAEQIARGAVPMIAVEDLPMDASAADIAEAELRCGRIPFVLARTMPDGRKETWRTSELSCIYDDPQGCTRQRS